MTSKRHLEAHLLFLADFSLTVILTRSSCGRVPEKLKPEEKKGRDEKKRKNEETTGRLSTSPSEQRGKKEEQVRDKQSYAHQHSPMRPTASKRVRKSRRARKGRMREEEGKDGCAWRKERRKGAEAEMEEESRTG